MSTVLLILTITLGIFTFVIIVNLLTNAKGIAEKTGKTINETRKQGFKSVTVMLALMVLLFGGYKITSEPDTPQSDQVAQSQVVTYDAESPEGKIQSVVVNTVDGFSFNSGVVTIQKIDVNTLDGGYNVNVWAKLTGQTWSEESALKAIKLLSIPIYQGAYTSGQPIERVSYIVMADMTDGKGNKHESKVFQSELRKDEAKQFNWSNAEAINPEVLNQGAFTHVSFRK